MQDVNARRTRTWKAILSLHREAEFVWVYFVPTHGAVRVRMVPIPAFTRMIEKGENISVASVISHVLRNDHFAEGVPATGALYLAPDLSTVSISPRLGEQHRLEVFAGLAQHDGRPDPQCSRQKLLDLCDTLHRQHGYYILVGYEIEVIFFKSDDAICQDSSDSSLVSNHRWSSVTSETREILPMVEAIVRSLAKMQIQVQQFHTESAPGQWEFVLPPYEPLEAVDTLIRARDIINLTAQDYGYRATLHPRPFKDHPGTGAHIHLSVNSVSQGSPHQTSTPQTDFFFGGIIEHFASLMAFCLPLDVSYERVAPSIWSGGEYVSWGWQNRHTPMRRIALDRFELKLHCGTANPYISLAAILAAGIDGLSRSIPLTAGPCPGEPSNLTTEERSSIGISNMVPRSLEASLDHLASDDMLLHVLGDGFVRPCVAVIKAWNAYLASMDTRNRRRWLLQEY
ncbi:hypothetical protein BDV30DRAFT_245974 [Aspergillus minisclerotigenes]|uniref:Glutamine synthetase n=1 Tax=Aspergillus minisclerotigenes TaxID=656917 RepID=A0A5N6IQG9_9EURO|nr:hypothetical protein BDV30DRAFT_245974 [Aspergillus minisclerotigenes]